MRMHLLNNKLNGHTNQAVRTKLLQVSTEFEVWQVVCALLQQEKYLVFVHKNAVT